MTNFQLSKMSRVKAYAETVLVLLSLSSCSKSSAASTTSLPTTTTVVVEVSADCAYYMDQNTYYVLSKSPTGYTYIYESLINCTRAEWLTHADSHRSEFAKWETYINAYYPYNFAGNGVLLADTDATETLDYVCMKQMAVRSGSDLTQLKTGACS